MSIEGRVTQDAIEVLTLQSSEGRVTQDAIEVLFGIFSSSYITQDIIEVLWGPPLYPSGLLLRFNGSTYDNVAEILNMDGPLKTCDLIDVTSDDSVYAEYISGTKRTILAFTMNFTESVFQQLNDDYNSYTPNHFRVQLDLENEFDEFDALISKLVSMSSVDGQVTARCEMVILN